MAEFTQEEVSTIERLVGEGGYSVQDAQDLIKGKKTPQSIFELKSQGLRTITDDSNNLDGFDKKLGIDTLKKLEERTDIKYPTGEDGITDPDTYMMNTLAPSYWDQVKARGIRTDKGLSAGDRAALSFGFSQPQYVVSNAKKLIEDNLKKQYPQEIFDKYKDNIKVQVADVGYGGLKSDALIYKIPKELGGDNYFRTVNKEGADLGDVPSVSGDSIPFIASTAGAIGGSAVSPVIGTALGAGGGEAIGELVKLLSGRMAFGLQPEMSNEEFLLAAVAEAGKKGITSGLTMGAFAKFTPMALQVAKRLGYFNIDENYLSSATTKAITNMEKNFTEKGVEGVINKETIDIVNKAKQTLIDSGAPIEEVNKLLSISFQRAFPESKLFQSLSEKQKDKILEILGGQESLAKTVINTVTKNLTGIDDLSPAGTKKALDNIKNKAETIIIGEQAAADQSVANNQLIRDKKLENLNFTPNQINLDNFGFYTTQLIEKVREKMGTLNTQITNFVKKNENTTRVDLDLTGDSKKTFSRILLEGKFDEPARFTIQPLKSIPKNATAEEKLAIEAENKIIQESNKLRLLFKTPEYQQTFNILKDLRKGFQDENFLGNLTYGDAKRTLNIIQNLEQQSLENPKLLGGIRTLKGNVKSAITAVENKPENELLKDLSEKHSKLLFAYQNSSLQDIAQSIGSKVTAATTKAADIQSEKIFNNIMGDSINARANSQGLGQILKSENFTVNDKFKSSLFKFYYDSVIKGSQEGASKLTHGEFMQKYATNFKNILGDDLFNQFKKGAGAAQQQVEKYVLEKTNLIKNGSKILPDLGLDIKNWTPEKIANAIIQKGETTDVNVLKKAFGSEQFKDVQNAFLQNMYDKTKGKFGQYEAFEGVKLLQYLKENGGIVKKFMGDNFYKVHEDLGRALTLLQRPEKIVPGLSGLTSDASKAGLFIDLIYGPLNHKRLAVTNIAKIYDAFDKSGKNIEKILNYQDFIELAKKQFLGGNYPIWFDKISQSQKSSLMSKLTSSLDQTKLGRIVKEVAGKTKLLKAGETIEKGAEKFKELSVKGAEKLGFEQKYKGMNLTPVLIDKYFEEGTIDPLAGSSNQRVGQPTIIEPAENVSAVTQKIIGKTIKLIAKDIIWDGAKWIKKTSKETFTGEPEYYKLKQLRKEAK
jgi:hypothetical protein